MLLFTMLALNDRWPYFKVKLQKGLYFLLIWGIKFYFKNNGLDEHFQLNDADTDSYSQRLFTQFQGQT